MQGDADAEDWREQGVRCIIYVPMEVSQNYGRNRAERKAEKPCIKAIDEWRGEPGG